MGIKKVSLRLCGKSSVIINFRFEVINVSGNEVFFWVMLQNVRVMLADGLRA